MSQVLTLPARSEVSEADTWDLEPLFATEDSWEAALTDLKGMGETYEQFRGKLETALKCF